MANESQHIQSHRKCYFASGLIIISSFFFIYLVGAYAQSKPMTVAKAKSPEEIEADKLNDEAVRLFREQKYQEAIPKAQQALALREKVQGAEATATMTAIANLAVVYSYADKHKEAVEMYQRLLKTQEKVFGIDDLKLCDTLSKLGWERIANGSDGLAESSFKRHLQIREKTFGKDDPRILPALNDLASYYQHQGEIDQAILFYRRLVALQEHLPSEKDTAKVERLVKYAVLLRARNKPTEADEMEARARKINTGRTPAAPPIKVSGGVLQGNAILKAHPDYPDEAKRSRVQGSVQVSVVVDEAGIVLTATALDGPPGLRKAAEEAAQKWRFSPTTLQGKPVQVQGILTFHFKLQ
ncbi:MAG: TonB family protein [Blastocatellia bacterium]|nr:TonB family protein [Blastocatellia bacterium]